MLCLSGFQLYSRWVPLRGLREAAPRRSLKCRVIDRLGAIRNSENIALL